MTKIVTMEKLLRRPYDYKPPKMVNMGVIKTISVSQSLQPYSPMVFQRRSFLKSHTSPSKSILLTALLPV